jgi:hypothetical protein
MLPYPEKSDTKKASTPAELEQAARARGIDDARLYIKVEAQGRVGLETLQRLTGTGALPRTATVTPAENRSPMFVFAHGPAHKIRSGGKSLGPGVVATTVRGSSLSARNLPWHNSVAAAPPAKWLLDLLSHEPPEPKDSARIDTGEAFAAELAGVETKPTASAAPTERAGEAERAAQNLPAASVQAVSNVVPFVAPAPTLNLEACKVFLTAIGNETINAETKKLSQKARHDLVSIDPANRLIEAATFLPGRHDCIEAWIKQQAAKKRNIYVAINEGSGNGCLNKKLSSNDVEFVRAIGVDLDPKKLAEGDATGAHFRSECERLLKEVAAICADPHFPPTITVYSGGGYWLLWCFEEKVAATPEVVALVEGIGRTLAKRFGGDSTFDISRIMRLPGTINYPDEGKAKQGRTPSLSYLSDLTSGKRYTLAALESLAPPTAKPESAIVTSEPIEWEMVWEDHYEDLELQLRAKFEAWRARVSPLDALWNGAAVAGQNDTSPSGFEYQLAMRLRHLGFTSTEFAQLRAVWEHRSEKSDHSQRLVQRAWDNSPPSALTPSGFDAGEIEDRPHDTALPASISPAKAATTSPGVRGDLAIPLPRFDPATLAPPPYVVPGLLVRRAVTAMTGPGGTLKSTFTLSLAVSMVTGRSDICGYEMTGRQRTWVYTQEDDMDLIKLRLAAIMEAFGVSHDDLHDEDGEPMLFINSGLGKGNKLTLAKRSGDRIVEGDGLASFILSAKNARIDASILDPLVSLHEAAENDNMQMRGVFDIINQITTEVNCAVLLVSHTGKPDKASSRGFAGDQHAARGASAQSDAARANVTFMGMSEGDLKAWRLPAGTSYLDYVRIDDAKFNIGKKRRTPRWFKREDVTIPGYVGESQVILRPIELEPAVAAGRPDLLEAVAKAIADHLTPGKPHTAASVAKHMPTSMAATMESKNRTRVINEAFGGEGVNEGLTAFGKLVRATGRGSIGTIFTLLLAPQNAV